MEASDAELRRLLGFGPAPRGWMAEVDSVGRALAELAGPEASRERKIEVVARWMGSVSGVRPRLSPDDTDLVPSLAWQRHQGGCTSLAWIWMRLGRSMGLELRPVLLPGHVVLRTEDGRFLETLRGGRERSAAFYDSAFRLDKRPAYRLEPEYLPVLEASFLVHRGLLRWKRGDLSGAESELRAAIGLAPHLPEAEGNLGLVLEARGDPAGALEHLSIALAGDSLNHRAKSRWEAIRGRGGTE